MSLGGALWSATMGRFLDWFGLNTEEKRLRKSFKGPILWP